LQSSPFERRLTPTFPWLGLWRTGVYQELRSRLSASFVGLCDD
jgi:hypothetical protein